MKTVSAYFSLLTALSSMAVISLFAQNPVANPGFEQWTSPTEPVGWVTNNLGGFGGPDMVLQSQTANSGSFSARLEVKDFLGSPVAGILYQDKIPVSGNVWSLSGYYHLQGAGGDGMAVTAYLLQDTTLVAVGGYGSWQNTSSFTQFAFNLEIVQPGVQPNEAGIFIFVDPDTISAEFHTGSYVLFDDIVLSPTPVTAIDRDIQIPLTPALRQNYPNPFNPVSIIEYQLPEMSYVSLKVYDVMGEEISTLVKAEQGPGIYRVSFDGSGLSSGVYFYRLSAGNFVATRRMILAK